MIQTLLKRLRGYSLDEAQQLDALLRTSATRRRQHMTNHSATLTLPPHRDTATESTPHSLRWYALATVAAALLLIAIPGLRQPSEPTVHAGDFSQQLTTVPGHVLQLLNTAAQQSQTHLPKISPLASLTVPELPAWPENRWLKLKTPAQHPQEL